jgi:hypothetical protein
VAILGLSIGFLWLFFDVFLGSVSQNIVVREEIKIEHKESVSKAQEIILGPGADLDIASRNQVSWHGTLVQQTYGIRGGKVSPFGVLFLAKLACEHTLYLIPILDTPESVMQQAYQVKLHVAADPQAQKIVFEALKARIGTIFMKNDLPDSSKFLGKLTEAQQLQVDYRQAYLLALTNLENKPVVQAPPTAILISSLELAGLPLDTRQNRVLSVIGKFSLAAANDYRLGPDFEKMPIRVIEMCKAGAINQLSLGTSLGDLFDKDYPQNEKLVIQVLLKQALVLLNK